MQTTMTLQDCWKRIGVHGDSSCPELQKHVHCRNCPVYSEAALQLLNRPLPANYLQDWAGHFAEPSDSLSRRTWDSAGPGQEEGQTKSLLIFRVEKEWLALPPELFLEVIEMRPIHSLPHRRNGVVLGLVNVRGGLLTCISLSALLGLPPAQEEKKPGRSRLLVVSWGEYRFAFPAHEVHGTCRYEPGNLEEVPATVAKRTPTYTPHILEWNGKAVACLDQNRLMEAFNRSLS